MENQEQSESQSTPYRALIEQAKSLPADNTAGAAARQKVEEFHEKGKIVLSEADVQEIQKIKQETQDLPSKPVERTVVDVLKEEGSQS